MRSAGRSHEDIVTWLLAAVAAELRLDPVTMDVDRALTFYGLDSLTAATIAGELSDWLGRQLPDDVLQAGVSINVLANRLARPVADDRPPRAVRRRRSSDAIDYAAIDYHRTPSLERAIRAVIRILVKVTSDVHVEGLDHCPVSGPALVASNHLHILDAVWMLAVLPRRTILLVAEEFERKPVLGWLLNIGRVIYISRGTADHAALDQALLVLRHGGALAVAPEGKLSRTGGLIRAHSGIAYLATHSGVPVTPAVLWGQERAWRSWLRLRRVRLEVRFGSAVHVPFGPAGPRELRRHTDGIMRSLAALLPPAYQGVYRTPSGPGAG
ncbi:MAG: 1-acyl-sn-glycerol-3-phosphate acyltransferase [Acidobacteria bacterium]|nr:1-acyl-sn-glycerol-3-phosphate acyltransferase [Acidobacteriota bacterium]